MTIGDGHDLSSPCFAGDTVLEACHDNEHRMLIKETGPAVAKVQRALADLGYFHTYREVDETFGPKTEAVVAKFKQEHNVFPADGVVARKTMETLDSIFSVRPLDPGAFASFVTAKQLDDDVADLLNEMHRYPADSWAHQVAVFVHHELTVGNLLGIVRASNSSNIASRLPASFLPVLASDATGVASEMARSTPVEVNPNQFQGYTLFNDTVMAETNPGHCLHFYGMLMMAHEMMHFRNRDFFVALDHSTVDMNPALFVNSIQANGFAGTQIVASRYMQELICDHVAFRVKQDTDLRFGHPSPAPQGGQFYRFALNLGRRTYDNGYLTALTPAEYNHQIAIWMKAAGERLFHDDPAKNQNVKQLFDSEFAAAQPGFATPTVDQFGGE